MLLNMFERTWANLIAVFSNLKVFLDVVTKSHLLSVVDEHFLPY